MIELQEGVASYMLGPNTSVYNVSLQSEMDGREVGGLAAKTPNARPFSQVHRAQVPLPQTPGSSAKREGAGQGKGALRGSSKQKRQRCAKERRAGDHSREEGRVHVILGQCRSVIYAVV